MIFLNGISPYSDPKSAFEYQQMIRESLHRLRSRGVEINDLDVMMSNGEFMFGVESNVGELVKEEINLIFIEEREKKINEILK
jgi:hypothetical protein